ncbi:MAG: sugar ABC transporter permease [Candidatus Dormibacteraeota bacterium]|nr:sugar ABC transporter permease [Candidatus Dormibacteraeota bacterium]
MSQLPITAAPPPMVARPARRGGDVRAALTGYAFSAPYLILFLVFLALPILASLVLSFTDFSLGDLTAPLGAPFIGLQNYAKLFSDDNFRQAALNTAYFTVVGLIATTVLGLVAALGLNRALGRLRSVFRVGYYLPTVTSIVAIAVIWRFLLDPNFGLINGALKQIGISGPNWLGNPTLAMPCIIAMAVWRNLGNVMVLFLAGLQGIPEDVYEAARIDGATPWRELLRITLPMLRPTLLFVAVITSIGYLQLFEEPFIMTQGGPLNKTLSVSMYMYREGFSYFHLGYASSIGYVLFVVIAAVTALQFRLLRND